MHNSLKRQAFDSFIDTRNKNFLYDDFSLMSSYLEQGNSHHVFRITETSKYYSFTRRDVGKKFNSVASISLQEPSTAAATKTTRTTSDSCSYNHHLPVFYLTHFSCSVFLLTDIDYFLPFYIPLLWFNHDGTRETKRKENCPSAYMQKLKLRTCSFLHFASSNKKLSANICLLYLRLEGTSNEIMISVNC